MDPIQFYKCLADETRLCCLLLIAQHNELCVCELTEALQQSQPKVSRHLALLRARGVLQDRRQGQWIFYQLSPELPLWAQTVIKETLQANANFIATQSDNLTNMNERPNRCCS